MTEGPKARSGVRTLSHLSVPADLDLLAVVPGVEDVLGAVEGNALLLNPLHTEDSSETQDFPVRPALRADDGAHAGVALQKHTAQPLGRWAWCRKLELRAGTWKRPEPWTEKMRMTSWSSRKALDSLLSLLVVVDQIPLCWDIFRLPLLTLFMMK